MQSLNKNVGVEVIDDALVRNFNPRELIGRCLGTNLVDKMSFGAFRRHEYPKLKKFFKDNV